MQPQAQWLSQNTLGQIAVCDLQDSISKVKLFKSIVGGNSSISLDLAASFDFPQKDEKISCIYELLL